MTPMEKLKPGEGEWPATQGDGPGGIRTQVCGPSVYACGPRASSPSSQEDFLGDPEPSCQGFPPVRGAGSPNPCPRPLQWLTDPGLCPKPAAGAGDTPSPRQGAWASGATPKIAQLSGPQIGLQPPCPDGAPGRAGSPSPSHCLHLLPPHTSALEPGLKSQPPS